MMIRKYERRHDQGFTFAELMIVIAIIAIFSMVAFPAFLSRLPDMRLRSAVRSMYADLQRVKLEAIKGNRCMGVNFSVGGGYTAFYDDDCDKNQDTGEQVFLSVSGTPGETDSLPGNVSISEVHIMNPFCYNPQGMICNSQSGNIVLVNEAPTWGRVRIRPAGGLQIQMSDDNLTWY